MSENFVRGTQDTHQIKSQLFEPLAKVSPVLEAHQTQLGCGEFSVDSLVAHVQEVWLIRTRLGPLSIGNIVPHPRMLAFLVPVAWRDEYRFNGILATDSTIFVGSSPDGYTTRGTDRDYFNVGLSREKFVASLAALKGVDPAEIALHDGAIELPPFSVARLRQIVGACLTKLSNTSEYDFRHKAEISELIYGTMLEAYIAGVPLAKINKPRAMSYERIVRLAEDHFMSAENKPLSLVELCRASGVGKTVFYEAFNSLYGVSPLQYFRKRRLMRARSQLILAPSEQTQVKEVALSLGLTHLGRFSNEYRRLFGETPSVTLGARFEEPTQ